ncbi:MAG: apolipoprotein N-acyltransferase [Treponemataceae bacterium]|nr:apolipoprotein N-acyltransferase [Treponemataceae bacterium]
MRILLPMFAALLLTLSIPNEYFHFGQPFFSLLALAPYFIALKKSETYREAALFGFLFGSISHATSSYWLYFFKDFALWTIGTTTVAYGLLHMLVAGFLRFVLVRSSPYRPFLVAFLWTTWEWGKSIGFLGYPWGLVAYGWNDVLWMIQIADILGVYGLSFLNALASAIFGEMLEYFEGRGTPQVAMALLRRQGLYLEKRGLLFTRMEFRPFLASYRPRGEPLSSSLSLSRATDFSTISLLFWKRLRKFLDSYEGALVICWGVVFWWYALYGSYRLAHPTPIVQQVPMLLIQHNADSWSDGEIPSLRKAIDLSKKGCDTFKERTGYEKPDLIVWSETVLRRPYREYRTFYKQQPQERPLLTLLAEVDRPLLTGAPEVLNWETYDATNSALLIDSRGNIRFSYAKQHPVPFAEAIPLWEYPWMRNFMQKVVGLDGGWVMGTKTVVMEIPTIGGKSLRFGVPICFEDAFAGVCQDFFKKGAEVLINITNDSWSKTVSAEIQHLVAARFRTVENRRTLVRATNGGVTAVIDAEGRILSQLPLFTEAYLATVVPVHQPHGPTLYSVWGDWFPFTGSLLVLWYILQEWIKEHRHYKKKRGPICKVDKEQLPYKQRKTRSVSNKL